MQFTVNTKKEQEIIDITEEVKKIVAKSNLKKGFCIVYVPHATSAIIINENYDPSVCDDILSQLDKIVPLHADYKHDAIDNNAAAHIKASILGPSEIILVEDAKLKLGRWQGLALTEFDGPRKRVIYVKLFKN